MNEEDTSIPASPSDGRALKEAQLPKELDGLIASSERWQQFVHLNKLYDNVAPHARTDEKWVSWLLFVLYTLGIEVTDIKKELNREMSTVDWQSLFSIGQLYRLLRDIVQRQSDSHKKNVSLLIIVERMIVRNTPEV
jgi:hypothetical protein